MIYLSHRLSENEIKEKIAFTEVYGKIFLVPTNRNARNLKKRFISSNITNFNIETLNTLCVKLFEKVQTFDLIDDATGSYLLTKSTRKPKPKFFNKFKEENFPKGTLEKIRSVISEYKRYGITYENLINEAEQTELDISEKNKIRDIAEIYRFYTRFSNELNAFEIGDIYAKLVNLEKKFFIKIFREVFPRVNTLIIRNFNEFSPLEIKLLKRFSEFGIELILIFSHYKKTRVFSAFNKTFDLLKSQGFIESDFELSENNEIPKYFGSHLFSINKTKKTFSEISLFYGKDIYEEVENIAKLLKDLITIKNVKTNDIAVVFNLVSEYSPVVRTVFEEYGIPLNLSDRLTLDKSPVVKALLTFLKILKDNYYYKTLFSAINSPFSESVIENPFSLQRFAQNNSIISAKKNWEEKLKEILNNNESYEIKRVKKDFNAISSLLEPLNNELTPDNFFILFLKFIKRLRIEKHLLNLTPEKSEENITALSSWIESISTVLDLLKKDEGEQIKHPFSFYFEIINNVASWTRFNVKERSGYGVLVTSIEEIRGLNFDYIFLGGLNDGILPLRYSPEIFFAKKFMKKEEEKLEQQRYLFYSVFTSFGKKIFLSFAKSSGESELSKSVFIADLLRIAKIKEIPSQYFENKLYSEREIQNNFFGLPDKYLSSYNFPKNKIEIYEERKSNLESIYNGYLLEGNDNKVKEHLKKISEGVFSVSQFESYAKCPFKYFLERILKIEPLEEPGKDIEPILIGNYLHEVLFEFYSELNEKQIEIHSKEAETLLFTIGENLFSEYPFTEEVYFYEKEKFFGVNGNKYDSIFYKFLEHERKAEEYTPKYFEVSFGKKLKENEKADKKISVLDEYILEGIRISGKIDRIDLNGKKFAVIDYKSGSKEVTYNSIIKGLDLQLPIYLKVAGQIFGEGYQPGMMGIFTLKFGEDKFGHKPIKFRKKELTTVELQNTIDFSVGIMKEYYSAISSGIFPPSNLENREKEVCLYCKFRSVCRVDVRG